MSTTDDDPEVTPGAVAAIAMALLVLVGVVVLFLLLKFNLFQGGSSNDVRTSSLLRTCSTARVASAPNTDTRYQAVWPSAHSPCSSRVRSV